MPTSAPQGIAMIIGLIIIMSGMAVWFSNAKKVK